jgi:hypothetical protein
MRYLGACWLSTALALAQPQLELLTVEYLSVSSPPWAPLCHCLPSRVSPHLLGSFLRLGEGDIVDSAALVEDMLRLQASGLFAQVSYQLDTLTPSALELRWRVAPRCLHVLAPTLFAAPGILHGGALVQTAQLWGNGERLTLRLSHRQEFSLGMQLQGDATLPLGERTQLELAATWNRLRHQLWLRLGTLPDRLPFRPWSAGAELSLDQGRLWDFRTESLIPYSRRQHQLRTWLSWGMQRRDQLFLTVSALWQRAHTDSGYRRAFDNTALLLLGVGSLAQRYHRLPSPEVQGDSCTFATGAWGAVTLALGFPTTGDGERCSYLAGELEQSGATSRLLLAGRIAAGNAFAQRLARYTLLETALRGWLLLPAQLTLAWEGQQRTIWNWSAYRAERLDLLADFPLPFPQKAAENVLRFRTELRLRGYPLAPELALGAFLFYHGGTLWNQGTPLARTRFRNATGIGAELFAGGVRTPLSALRLELAYVFSLRRFLPRLQIGIVPPQRYLHRYRFPEPLGLLMPELP